MNLTVHTWTAISILVMILTITFMDWVPTSLNKNIHGMSVQERLPSTLIHSTLGIVFALMNIFSFK